MISVEHHYLLLYKSGGIDDFANNNFVNKCLGFKMDVLLCTIKHCSIQSPPR